MDVPGYGLFAHQSLDSLRSGARVEADEQKRSPLDFVLWKKAKPGEPSWPSPWGQGRPGWHTECVVMSLDLLGDGFDLHGGAIDLIFPHHENERAQAVAEGREFARHWVHNGWVTMEGEKMSKSLGNFTSLSDLLVRSDARAYRLLVLRSHYRSPIEVTPDTVADAEAGLARLDELARRFELADPLADGPWSTAGNVTRRGWTPRRWPGSACPWTTTSTRPAPWPGCSTWCGGPTPRPMPGTLPAPAGRPPPPRCCVRRSGLALRPGSERLIDPATAELVRRRDQARAERDLALADAVASELEESGWLVEDGPEGTRIRRR